MKMRLSIEFQLLTPLHFSVPLRLCASALILTLSLTITVSRADQPNRSPVDLVLGPNDAWLATVNQTSDTVSLVRTSDGQVLDEMPVGHHPVGIALAPDQKTLLVTGHYSGDVTLLEVSDGKLKKLGEIDVGYQPHGIAVTPDGKAAYVACTAS